jgi:hypothetical protein
MLASMTYIVAAPHIRLQPIEKEIVESHVCNVMVFQCLQDRVNYRAHKFHLPI